MMNQILLILTIIASPSLIYAGSGCEIVSTSLYDDISGFVSGGEGSFHTKQCATVIVKNTSGGGRLGGKITAKFMDGQTKSKSFESDRISDGQLVTTNICWGRKSQLESMDCNF